MFFGDIFSIENVRLDIRGNLLTLNSSVLIIGYSLIKSISFSPFVPTKGAKFVPASGSKLACTRNERSRIS